MRNAEPIAGLATVGGGGGADTIMVGAGHGGSFTGTRWTKKSMPCAEPLRQPESGHMEMEEDES